MVEGVYDVKLYPEDGESTTILNVKRGIVSALAVPLLEEDKNKNMVCTGQSEKAADMSPTFSSTI